MLQCTHDTSRRKQKSGSKHTGQEQPKTFDGVDEDGEVEAASDVPIKRARLAAQAKGGGRGAGKGHGEKFEETTEAEARKQKSGNTDQRDPKRKAKSGFELFCLETKDDVSARFNFVAQRACDMSIWVCMWWALICGWTP